MFTSPSVQHAPQYGDDDDDHADVGAVVAHCGGDDDDDGGWRCPAQHSSEINR